MKTALAMDDADDYLGRLGLHLALAGIPARQRDRILIEAADHLAEGEVDDFGDPQEIAQRFADELATAHGRRAAFRGFAALAATGAVFAAGWLLVPLAGGWPDVTAATLWPLALAAALGMVVCSQVSFAAGVLALLRAHRLRGTAAAPAAEVALLVRRTRTALLFGAFAMASLAVYAVMTRGDLAGWYAAVVAPTAALLTVPLVGVARSTAQVARMRTSVPGPAGDVFDDLPIRLPHRPWLLCLGVATLVALAALLAGGVEEGPRNAVAEFLLVVGCFAALGRRLGLRG